MIFKSKAERTIEKANRILTRTSRRVRAKNETGGLSAEDKMQCRREMDKASELDLLSNQQNKTSLLGDMESALRRLFTTGQLAPTKQQIDQQWLDLYHRKNAILKSLRTTSEDHPEGFQ